MTCGCDCHMGLSARAIKYRGETNHPHDPVDLRRCIDYCRSAAISPSELQHRMAGRSPEWDALLPYWDELVVLLNREMDRRRDGRAPKTYARMRELLDGSR